ncbi:unnamed protein product [Rotaria magnacalcarata]|uniref:Uncharacterized protein n=1 Tax=Rotaria magnacalcarata TaxID=392030 RepID=A0A819ZC16_9BILA|nr:unnamed protein product [Rotaria magnacalcarata]CAF4174702.1 unnamed protein product [Rotaria magnacalcarata]
MNEFRSVTPIDHDLVTPVSGSDPQDFLQLLRSSNVAQYTEPLTAQSIESSFPSMSTESRFRPIHEDSNYGIEENERSAKYAEGHILSQFDLDSILASNDPFLMSDSSCIGSHDSYNSLDYGLPGPSKHRDSFLEEKETDHSERTSHNLDSVKFPMYYPSSHSNYSSNRPQTQYTGFTVQGGRIPNIPCDTGVGHSRLPLSSTSPELTYPHDPLSPPFIGMQGPLPPPLVPTASGTRQATTQKKGEDKIDKMVNLLGDIVNTFDNLI